MSEEQKQEIEQPSAEAEVGNNAPSDDMETPAEIAVPKKKRAWTFGRVFVLTLLILLLGGLFNRSARPVDDAYITFRYAQNLVDGHGLAYNIGSRVEGYTSLGQVLLTAPIIMVDKRFAWLGSIFLGLLAWALMVSLSWRFIRRWRSGELDRPDWFFLVYLGFCNPAVVWAWSGMEAAAFTLAWVGAWLLHQKEYEENQWPYLSALVTFGAGLLHPEGILIAVVLGIAWFIPFDKQRLTKGLAYLGIALGLFGLYWLWRWNYFGHFFPNTFYAKVGGGGGLRGKGLRYLFIGALSSLVPFYMIYLIVRRWSDRAQWPRWMMLAFGMIGAVIVYNLIVGGDYFSFQRFLLPAFPFTLMIVWKLWHDQREAKAAVEDEQETEGADAPPKKRHPLLYVVLIVVLINFWSGIYKLQMMQHKLIQTVVPEFAEAGQAIAQTMPPKTKIATIPIGAFGYFSERPILDIAGLTDPHIAHLEIPTGERNVGHEKFDYKYILHEKPAIIVQLPALFPFGEQALDEWLTKTTLNPIQYRIYDHPELARSYRLAWLPVTKKRIRAKGKALREMQDVGIYAFVRKTKMTTKPFKEWKALPNDWNNRVFVEAPARAAENPLAKLRGGLWTFQGGEQTDLPEAPEPPAEPIEVTPLQNTPPPVVSED